LKQQEGEQLARYEALAQNHGKAEQQACAAQARLEATLQQLQQQVRGCRSVGCVLVCIYTFVLVYKLLC
jgi:hypothetical protein